MKKRLISVLLACMMILTVLPAIVGAGDAAAADDIVIRIENEAQLTMTEGSTVSVDVYMDINTENGVVSATIPVAWNNKTLELTGVENGTAIPTGWYGAPVTSIREEMKDGTTLGIYYLAWNNDTLCKVDADGNPIKDENGNYMEESYKDGGLLCTLKFKLRNTVTAGEKYDVVVVTKGDNAAIMNVMNWAMEDFVNPKKDDAIYGQTIGFVDGGIVTIDRVQGDFTNDNLVTAADAIYLLYHSYYPEDYPIESGNVDYTGDNVITAADAIYLLYHSYYPEDYPLS